MKPFYTRYVASLGALLLLALSLIGCQDTLLDRTQPDPTSPEQIGDGGSGRLEGAVTVSIAYDTPALRTPQTRALSVEQESELKLATTRVMVFDDNGVYQYDAPLTHIDRKDSDKQQGTLTVQIKPGKGLGIVVLANLSADDKVKKVSGTKAEILKSFEYTATADFTKTGLPMWGELAQQTIDPDVSAVQTIGTIHLLRAVARVDVGLNMDAKGTSGKDGDFDEKSQTLTSDIVDPASKKSIKVQWSLLEVKLYNAAKNGRIAPDAGNYVLDGDKKPKAKKVTQPTTPTKQEEALTYKAMNNLLMRTIYVPETVNPEPTSASAGASTTPGTEKVYLSRPYLILKLSYKQTDGTASGETYFRVDFLKRGGDEATAMYTYLPLLRNYRYKVDIKNIGGLGFDNEDDAKKGPSANIMYNVLVWDESEMSNVKYDGQYMLGVSKNLVTTYKSGSSMHLKVQTSWPKGFTIEGLPEGFTVEPTPGTGNTFATTDEVDLTLTPPADWAPTSETKTDEKGKEYKEVPLTIVAGRMKWNVRVRQYQFDKVDIQLFRDRDLTQPVEFLTIHELGKAMLDPSITNYKLSDFDNKMYYGTNQLYIDKYNKAVGTTLPATSAPWFDMDKANKASGSTSDFTALTSGAVRVFYAKVDAPKGSTFTFGPQDGGKGQFTVEEITATANPALPADIRMFMVTADEMTNTQEYFEVKSGEYVFKVKAPATSGGLTAEATINFDQREYDAAIFVDEEMKDPLFGNSNNPVLLLNGETLHYKLRSNSNYYSVVLRQRGSEVTPATSQNPDGTLKHEAVGITQINGKSWNTPVSGDANFNGDPFEITLRNDLKDSKVVKGYADIEAKIQGMPFHFYKARVMEVGLISADFVRENHVANSYQLVVDGGGLFIPIEKWINDAAEEYNSRVSNPYRGFSNSDNAGFTWSKFMEQNQLQGISPLDEPYSELLWTDAYDHPNKPTDGKVVGKGSNTAFIAHGIYDYNGKLYLFVKPGSLSGNSVIAIRSTTREPKIPYIDIKPDEPYYHSDPAKNKAILWSFHFVVYPKTINTANILNHVLYVQDTNEDYKMIINDVTRRFFNRNYGALITAKDGGETWYAPSACWDYNNTSDKTVKIYKNTKYEAQGMGYQWGRKDPVPLIAENLSHDFYREDGKQVGFTLDKSRLADPSKTIVANKMSVRETIERPMYFVPGNTGIAQGNWMTEFGYAPESYAAAENSSWQGSRIWGGNGNVNDGDQRSNIAQSTRKTHFDPSPYGFAVPSSGFEFGRYFPGTATTANYRANIPTLLANTLCTPDRSFTQYTSVTKMKWLTSNCYETRDAPSLNIDNLGIGSLANNASATNRSSLTPYRPVLQIECLSDWKTVNKIPMGNDGINKVFHKGHQEKEYKPFTNTPFYY